MALLSKPSLPPGPQASWAHGCLPQSLLQEPQYQAGQPWSAGQIFFFFFCLFFFGAGIKPDCFDKSNLGFFQEAVKLEEKAKITITVSNLSIYQFTKQAFVKCHIYLLIYLFIIFSIGKKFIKKKNKAPM
jgi:hypothetical protein